MRPGEEGVGEREKETVREGCEGVCEGVKEAVEKCEVGEGKGCY